MMHLANRHFGKNFRNALQLQFTEEGKGWRSPEHVVVIIYYEKRVELGDKAMVHMNSNNYEKFCCDFFIE